MYIRSQRNRFPTSEPPVYNIQVYTTGNGRPGQLCGMPGDVYGRRTEAHLPRFPREDTFVIKCPNVDGHEEDNVSHNPL